MANQFWEDLRADLKDPEFARAFAAESIRISTIDALVNELDDLRESLGMSKAELARAVNSNPSTIRRLLSASNVNPTVGTLAELAGALGMRLTLSPLSPEEREQITAPLQAAAA